LLAKKKDNTLAKTYLRKAGAEPQRLLDFSLRLRFFARQKKGISANP